MKKILVTTDFSQNSRAAINVAKSLAIKGDYELTFFHACHLMQPTLWNERTFHLHEKREFAKAKKRLASFAREASNDLDKIPAKTYFATVNSAPPSKAIIEYAIHYKYDFICISTNGAGRFRRILGSVVSHLIKNCPVPLIVVSTEYTPANMSSILWASDFSRLENEIPPATEFAKSIGASLNLLHLLRPEDANIDPGLIRQMIRKRTAYPVELHLKETDWRHTLLCNMQAEVQKISPSILLMFSDQNKSFLENIVYPGVTEDYVYKSVRPVVIFKK